MQLKRRFPKEGARDKARWMTRILRNLEGRLPLDQLLDIVGDENYVLTTRINGFREGDEDGDLEYFSNSYGRSLKKFEAANGIIGAYARETGILPIELRRTQGSFR